ncbi:DbpA RNA binding domain-containing protein [Methylobacter sp.]|uniref:DbpA RNA binding domain-containing protein n=1 Tax=Methylobacter sp. TaxID=2051955 RepID=UPI002FDDB908
MINNNKYDGMDTRDTTPRMGEVEQRREQLPKASKIGALGNTGTIVDGKPSETVITQPSIKMVRYRLDVGSQHQVTSEELKKVLIEESGVDKNNINNINIQRDYTLVELPDEMPQDIFLHLKSVEIKQRKLDIKRVKARNKKRSNNYSRRGRQRTPPSNKGSSNQAGGS